MQLTELAAAVPSGTLLGSGGVTITGITHDSRGVKPGDLFVAVPGLKMDGHVYLGQAASGGVAAVVVQADRKATWEPLLRELALTALVVPDTRMALASLSAALFEYPARKLNVIGVTGTDGKTSVCHLVTHLLSSSGQKVGVISTAECRIGDEPLADTGRFTTPEAPQVQQMLAQMVQAECEWAVIEATSHGLALHRVDECEYDIAAFTNFGADHLDFHGSREEYLVAKGRLFQMLDQETSKRSDKIAVLNGDDPACDFFRRMTSAKNLVYAIDSAGDLHAREVMNEDWGARFVLEHAGREWPVHLNQPGRASVHNALAAAGICIAAGMDTGDIVSGLGSWWGAPGRMQRIDAGQNFAVVVDFAHAADSLRAMLQLLREISRGRIIAVFGCIGERDKDRRAAMGRVAAENADYTIVTDDNPYTEDRQAILGAIADALRRSGKREGHDFAVIADRREAIAQALAMAVDEDAVVLAGKGHEKEVHLGETSYPCDDAAVAREVLSKLGYGG